MKIPSPSTRSSDNSGSTIENQKNSSPDFSEYMWMENEEEFDEEVMIYLFGFPSMDRTSTRTDARYHATNFVLNMIMNCVKNKNSPKSYLI